MAEESTEAVKTAGPSSPPSPHSNGGVKASSPRSPRQIRRIKLTEQQLDNLSKDELVSKWREEDTYVDYLELQNSTLEGIGIT